MFRVHGQVTSTTEIDATPIEAAVDVAPTVLGEGTDADVATETTVPDATGEARVLNRHERSEVLRAKLKEKGFNHNSVQRRRLPFNP